MSRRSRSFFSELVNATTKRFHMMVNYPLSRGLGNIAKVYLITCSQSTCAKPEKIRILSRRSRWICPYISIISIFFALVFSFSTFIRHCASHDVITCILHTLIIYSDNLYNAYIYIYIYIHGPYNWHTSPTTNTDTIYKYYFHHLFSQYLAAS